MKQFSRLCCAILCSCLLFTACQEPDNPVTPVNPPVTAAYIIGKAQYYTDGYSDLTNYNFVYPSTDPYGHPVMLSGTITMGPEVTKTVKARGIVLYNRYTIYKTDDCPSMGKLDMQQQFKGSGLIIVAADLYGFGSTANRQQAYCMARANAQASLDALIAARQLLAQEGYRFGDALFNVGFSQGAQTAIGVLRLATEQHPDIRFTRTMAGAGPYDLAETYRQLIVQDAQGASSNAISVLLAYNEYAGLGYPYASLFNEPVRSHVADWLLSKRYKREEIDELIGKETKLSECLAPALLDLESDVAKRFIAAFDADNLCKGWTPRCDEDILLFHSKADMTVPVENTDGLYRFLKDQGMEQVELMEGQWGVFFGAEAHTVSSLTFIAEAKKWLCAYFGIPEW